MRYIFSLLIFITMMIPLFANNLYTVDNPTAAQLERGEARVDMKLYKENGIAIGADVGLFENFQFGVSYCTTNLIGDKEPEWLNKVEFKGRFRIINEDILTPALSIGVDTQGHGAYSKANKRYDMMSKGLYTVASKNFNFLGLLGFDVGCNYTFEKSNTQNKHFDIFAGAYKTIGEPVTVFIDWSAGINDYTDENYDELPSDIQRIIGRGRSYINTGVQVSLTENFALKLLMYDMFRNKRTTELFDRALILDYRWHF